MSGIIQGFIMDTKATRTHTRTILILIGFAVLLLMGCAETTVTTPPPYITHWATNVPAIIPTDVPTDAPVNVGNDRNVRSQTPQSNDEWRQWDSNNNGRITCAEARQHGIAPVSRNHPAYSRMDDRDKDGVVCE